jgi:hypothetical protein
LRWRPSKTARRAGLGVLAAGFLFGLLRLFVLRFEAGDVHPPYSSLRKDPLGTAVLYEGLDRLPDVAVRRNFEPLHRMPADAPATLLYLGVSEDWRPAALKPELLLDRVADRGGRLVIAFHPRHSESGGCSPKGCTVEAAGSASGRKARRNPSDPKEGAPAEAGEEKSKTMSLGALLSIRLGVRLVPDPAADAPDDPNRIGSADAQAAGLADRIRWHGRRHFKITDAAWKTLYARAGRPVAVERDYGPGGRIVLVSDSYLFSNEALSRHRESGFLAYVIGPGREIVFDETHLGLVDRPTIARLIRMHGFHWFLLAAASLALLYAWRRAAPLGPPAVAGPSGGEGPGDVKDAFRGWVSLLRRNIDRREILGVCIEEWARTAGPEAAPGAAAVPVSEMKRMAREAGDPVEGYRRVSAMIAERKTHE